MRNNGKSNKARQLIEKSLLDKGLIEKRLVEKQLAIFGKLNRSQRLYYFAAFFAVIALLVKLVPGPHVFMVGSTLCAVLFFVGIVSDIIAIYNRAWETAIGKALMLMIYAVSTSVAYGISSQVLNEVVKFDASELSYALNYVAVLLVPLFVFASAIVIFSIVLIVSQFYWMFLLLTDVLNKSRYFTLNHKIEEYPFATFFARLCAFAVVSGFIVGAKPVVFPAYTEFVERSTSAFIYHLEAVRFSRCKAPADARVIRVNDNEIIVAEKRDDNYSFTPMKCVPLLE